MIQNTEAGETRCPVCDRDREGCTWFRLRREWPPADVDAADLGEMLIAAHDECLANRQEWRERALLAESALQLFEAGERIRTEIDKVIADSSPEEIDALPERFRGAVRDAVFAIAILDNIIPAATFLIRGMLLADHDREIQLTAPWIRRLHGHLRLIGMGEQKWKRKPH